MTTHGLQCLALFGLASNSSPCTLWLGESVSDPSQLGLYFGAPCLPASWALRGWAMPQHPPVASSMSQQWTPPFVHGFGHPLESLYDLQILCDIAFSVQVQSLPILSDTGTTDADPVGALVLLALPADRMREASAQAVAYLSSTNLKASPQLYAFSLERTKSRTCPRNVSSTDIN